MYKELSGCSSGVDDIKQAIQTSINHQRLTGTKPVVFIDEIHRFTKAQQDVLLPPVEQGVFTLIAATTENPSFRVNSALLSRAKVFVLSPLSSDNIAAILRRAASLARSEVLVADNVLDKIAGLADGDARTALNTLEMVLDSVLPGEKEVQERRVDEALQKRSLLYDKDGEEHYNIISAMHKSLRGSDADAALYWLGRMIYAGEDPLYVARRLIRFASEDVGLADSSALTLAVSTYQAVERIGMPESDVILAHCCTYLARAPKSVEVYRAIKKVRQTVETTENFPVPLHIRNAPTKLMKEVGYGKGYMYNPDHQEPVNQDYLPTQLTTRTFFS